MPSPTKNKTEKRLETLAVKTKSQKVAFLEQLPKYPIVQVACEKSGVGRSTYYAWRKDDKEFAKSSDKAIEAGTSFINDMAESKLIQNVQSGNNTAIIFWLKNHHGSYNDRIVHEHEHSLELLDEDKKAIVRALMNIGLGSVLKNNGSTETVEEWHARKEREQEEHMRRANGEPEPEPVPVEEKWVKYIPPKKVEPPPPPPEKPYIRMKDRPSVNYNDYLRKRKKEQEKKERLEGK